MDNNQWVFRANVPVRWGDMDAFGHVNNAVYFSYLEQARAEWWSAIDIRHHQSHVASQYGPVVLTANCHYKRPIFYPDELRIDIYASPPGRSSFDLSYEICSIADPDTVCTEGHTKIVWVDYQAEKAVRLPDVMIAHLPTHVSAS